MFIDYLSTFCFGLAVLHTFLVGWFQHIALKYRPGSVLENFFHLIGEVEVVFGVWAGLYLFFRSIVEGSSATIVYLESRSFIEPAFVFVVMVVCASRPIIELAGRIIHLFSRVLPLPPGISFYVTTLIIGPLLGSFITEPAAMTVTALLLVERYYKKGSSQSLMYATIGLLFVNVSIGGMLTPYAAPPVLMVAGIWKWNLHFMLSHFGCKAVLAIVLSTAIVSFQWRKELGLKNNPGNYPENTEIQSVPIWVSLIHLFFLGAIVFASHHLLIFILLFLFFLGLTTVTREYQHELKIKEGLLVSFFLMGLVILGGPQRWWLEPIIANLNATYLYLGAILLTAFTDNAALTYLGAQVPSLTEVSKYALVAGSVVGGGLTVIANAPNLVGYGILNPSFGSEGINPFFLFKYALVPTLIAAVCFWFL